MKIVFRVDSGLIIGSGHLQRCITLAHLLSKGKYHTCIFVCRPHTGHMSKMVMNKNYTLLLLPASSKVVNKNDCSSWLGASPAEDAAQTKSLLMQNGITDFELLVIDHYAIDHVWQNIFVMPNVKVLVIDDLADRAHNCDFLLDQNVAPDYLNRYDSLVPDNCRKFLGISYCLLQDQFFESRKGTRPRSSLKNLLIFFGGVDLENYTSKVLLALASVLPDFDRIDVIVGHMNPNKKIVKSLCSKVANCIFHEQIDNMAEILSCADFSIGACGATTGERIFLGLPSIVFSVAQNQVEVSKNLHNLGYVYYLDDSSYLNGKSLEQAISSYLSPNKKISKISSQLLSISESNLDSMIKELNAI